MPILPVLDLMHGQIVRGIAGRRDEYRPIVSHLVDSAEPLAVAKALANLVGSNAFYLADLDAIGGGEPSVDVYRRLQHAGFYLWIDAGLTTRKPVRAFEDSSIIVGLETVQGPDELRALSAQVGVRRTVFSLDLKANCPLGMTHLWPDPDPWHIARHAVEVIGIQRLIVLDLACVGVGQGVGTEQLCQRLRGTYPKLEITAGGGVRGIHDVRRLMTLGVDYVLTASALHDGRISAADLTNWQ